MNISQIATSSFEDNFEIVRLLSGISNAVKYHNLTKKILRGGEQIKVCGLDVNFSDWKVFQSVSSLKKDSSFNPIALLCAAAAAATETATEDGKVPNSEGGLTGCSFACIQDT